VGLPRHKNGVSPTFDHTIGPHPVHSVLSAINRMPESCRVVARYIIDNPRRVASLSIDELADVTGSNKTTVVRVCKLSGYKGYRELRSSLLENRGLIRGAELLGFDVPDNAAPTDDTVHIAREVIKINLEVLRETLTLLEGVELRTAVASILRARQVFLVGFGSSGPVAQDAYQRFVRLQIPCSVCTDSHVLAVIAANLKATDVLLSITYSGQTRDIVEAQETAHARGATNITLTSAPDSTSAGLSDIVIVSAARRRPFAAETVASRVAQLAVVDVLSTLLALNRKGALRGSSERIEEELIKKRIKIPFRSRADNQKIAQSKHSVRRRAK
jgi:RpiR family transcriptional regulator, carbohydrate utilization regulator